LVGLFEFPYFPFLRSPMFGSKCKKNTHETQARCFNSGPLDRILFGSISFTDKRSTYIWGVRISELGDT
jgi:hypothetical protein